MKVNESGWVIDPTISEEELIALWDVRDNVFTFYGEEGRLPNSFSDLLSSFKKMAKKYPGVSTDIQRALIQNVESLPLRLDKLELTVADDEQWFKVSFVGSDGVYHEYDPTTPNYPTSIS